MSDLREKAIEELKRRAEEGDQEAQSALILLYDLGLGGKTKRADADKWLNDPTAIGPSWDNFTLGGILTKTPKQSTEE